MTQNSSPWDGISVGDAANAPYSSDEWAHLWALKSGIGSAFPNYGIIPGTGDGTSDPLQVKQTSIASANIEVQVGAALVHGKLYESSAAENLAISANVSGNPRIDTVVLRIDYLAQTVRLVVRQGTAAVSPVRVTLTQSASIWEIPLADIRVANGFSTIGQADITDRRRAVTFSSAGWQSFAHPMSYIYGLTSYTGSQGRFQFMMPFVITGNMLVKQLILRSSAALAGQLFTWGMYRQYANDQAANDKLLGFVGGFASGLYSVNVLANTNFTLPAQPPFYLSPGHYWLAINNASSLSMPYQSFTTAPFDNSLASMLTPGSGSFTIGSPIDTAALAFSPVQEFVPARLEGVIFGATP